MGWQVHDTWLSTAAVNGTPDLSIFQPFKSVNRNVIVELVRTWFVFATPSSSLALTNLTMQIYSNDVAGGNVPGHLLATSTSLWTKAQLITDDYGVIGVPFAFTDFLARKNDLYHLVPKTTGYTGTSTSNIGWRKGYPDPTYRSGLTLDYAGQLTYPRMVSIFGKQL